MSFSERRALRPFYQTHRDEVRETMTRSVRGMLEPRAKPANAAEAERNLADLEHFAASDQSPDHALLDARSACRCCWKKMPRLIPCGPTPTASRAFP